MPASLAKIAQMIFQYKSLDFTGMSNWFSDVGANDALEQLFKWFFYVFYIYLYMVYIYIYINIYGCQDEMKISHLKFAFT